MKVRIISDKIAQKWIDKFESRFGPLHNKDREYTQEEKIAIAKKEIENTPSRGRKKSKLGLKAKGKFYMADFETTTYESRTRCGKDYVEVWAWATCPIPCSYELSDCEVGNSADSFMEWCMNNLEEDDTVFFHNLTFDGNFILPWLINNGYQPVTFSFKNKWQKGFSLLSGDMAGFYQLKVNLGNGTFNIIDSLKLLPFPVHAIGDSFKTKNRKLLIDYDAHDGEGEEITEEEKKYVCNDVLVVAQALWETLLSRGYNKMTIGSNAMADFHERLTGKPMAKGFSDEFRSIFPELSEDENAFARKSYRGGISYVNPKIAEKEIIPEKKGTVADVHSMYPGVMHSSSGNYYPVGYGVPATYPNDPEQIVKYLAKSDKLAIIHVKALLKVKPNHMPCIQLKGTGRFSDTEYIEDMTANGNTDLMDLYCCSPEFILWMEQYDVLAFEFVEAYEYNKRIGLFDNFIDYWYNIKRTTSGAEKQLAKLMLNNLYGKFATADEAVNMNPYMDDTGKIKYASTTSRVNTVHMPVGSFVTCYARCKLTRAIQANFEHFLYCDTDSVHMDIPVDEAQGMVFTKDDVGTWGVENEFVKGKYLRQKTYLETMTDGTNTWNEVRCAGLPKSKKVEIDGKVQMVGPRELVTYDNFSFEYDWGAPESPFKNCKLRRRVIKGGVELVPADFKIRR